MGRWSNAKRAEMAAKAAAEAASAAGSTEQAVEAVEPTTEKPDFQAVNPRNNPRDAAMDEIISRHEAPPEPVETPAEEPAAAPAAEKQAEAEPTEKKVEPAAAAEPAKPEPIKTVRVKVDGDEYDAPQEDVDSVGGLKAYQIIKAQENRLKKMNDTLSETRKTQAAVAQWVQQQAAMQQPQAPKLTDDQFINSKIDVIRFGSPEESSAALKEVMTRAIPQVDPNTIMNRAVAQVRQNAAVDKFKEEFADIAANPLLYKLAATLENEVVAKFPANAISHPSFASSFDWMTLYRGIGNQIRGVVGKQNQQPGQPQQTVGNTSQPSEKEARKASIVALPTASARAELPKEQKPETRADIIQEMKKSRGLPTG